MSTQEAEQLSPQSAPKPALRSVREIDGKYFEIASFTPNTNPSTKHAFSGMIKIAEDQDRVFAYGFIHDRKDNSGRKVISLTAYMTDQASGEQGYKQIATGSVVNHRNDGKDVYYDTVLFNRVDGNGNNLGGDPIAVFVTDSCPSELHSSLGFADRRIPRPPKDTAEQADEADAGRPRGPRM